MRRLAASQESVEPEGLKDTSQLTGVNAVIHHASMAGADFCWLT